MIIERTLFWFKDNEKKLLELNDRFFPYGVLLNRLLNEKYKGKKIKFINIDFASRETYEKFPQLPLEDLYFYGEHLRYYGVLDFNEFNLYPVGKQIEIVWEKARDYLVKCAEKMNNPKLNESINYAYAQGKKLNLNPDYKVIEKSAVLFDINLIASIWIYFKVDGMYSKFTLEKDNVIVFEKEIDKTKNGVEFFLEIYKDIQINGNNIIIKGHSDVDNLPFNIPIRRDELHFY
jgi:hypothetical protein